MVKRIVGVMVVLVSAFLMYVALKPSDYYIKREITIHASPEQIFPWINTSKKIYDWMPWLEMDPKMAVTYSGAEAGVGAQSSWEGTEMGVGSALVVESVPNKLVKTKLDYKKPMEGTQMAEITITSSGLESVVSWSVRGENTFFARLLCTVMNMDKMVGGMFEKGLSTLKKKVEQGD